MRRHNRKPDTEYLAFIHGLPCCAGEAPQARGSACSGRITAHHAGPRGLMQRADDRTAIPLCEWHHQDGPFAVHRMGKRFYEFHGLDKEQLIADLNAEFEKERAA